MPYRGDRQWSKEGREIRKGIMAEPGGPFVRTRYSYHARSRRTVGLLLFLAIGVMSFGVASASASQFVLSHSFAVAEAKGVAVNQTTGQVYVVGGEKVIVVDSSGVPDPTHPELTGTSLSSPAGVAVDNSDLSTSGDIYVAERYRSGVIAKFNPLGEYVETVITEADIPPNERAEGGFAPDGIAVNSNGDIFVADSEGQQVDEFSSGGSFIGRDHPLGDSFAYVLGVAVDTAGNVYVGDYFNGLIELNPALECLNLCAAIDGRNSFQAIAVDGTDGNIYADSGNQIFAFDSLGRPIEQFGGELLSGSSDGVGVNETSGLVFVSDPGAGVVDVFEHTVPVATTGGASEVGPSSVSVSGHVDPAGYGNISGCRFEYGTTVAYGLSVPCSPLPPFSKPTEVSTDLPDLQPGTVYHFRLAASNGSGTGRGGDATFRTLPAPSIGRVSVVNATEASADLTATINPNGANTTYRFEYGRSSAYGEVIPSPSAEIGTGTASETVTQHLAGLEEGMTYHFRVFAQNASGITVSRDYTFVTCPNSLARQQTGAANLLDCRAYELVSAADAGGYSVESDLVPGQTPYGGYPQAGNPPRVLYAVHDGGIPGTDDPTNRGPDPYVATRTANGWSTEYVGIPANIDPASDPFSSTLAEASPNLETFAFAGQNLCAPCFGSGIETGIPLHLPNGSLVQGMAGSINPGSEAKPDGHIAKYFSADGSHFIFGSTSQFEPDANNNGDVSIYDRDLSTGETHVVSKTPSGENLPCLQGAGSCHSPGDPNGIAELDVSKDGSRIIVAQKVSEDADHNVYWHPYMNIGDSSKTIDLAPGSTSGVLYDGMSEDGSKVFFTTTDKLLAADTDESADIYEAEVGSEGNLNLQLLSSGTEGAGNSDACDPVSNEAGAHWNSLEATPNCGVVAIGGGGGVASEDGTVYFLSPALLDGGSNGTANQPNLYVVRPGSAPQFVATLAPNDPTVVDGLTEAGTRHTADFQVTPSGEYAVFPSTQQLGTYENTGDSEIYRYDAGSGQLDCVSCNPSNAAPTGAAHLAQNGLSLTDDGRVFFNSPDALSLRDLDVKEDVYEWESSTIELISSGTSPFASSLLGVTANGEDVYFFTHDQLVSGDRNGHLVKIYDARSAGGFFVIPEPPPCKASDECHGPSSPLPPAPNIKSIAVGGSGNYVPPSTRLKCKRGFIKRHSRCVKNIHSSHHHHHHETPNRHRNG